MKTITVKLFVTLCALSACTDYQKAKPTASASAEKVYMVLYFSDGEKDFKSVGETILLNTGETVKVQRGVVRPDLSLITQDWNRKFLPAAKAPPTPGTVELSLDRSNGVVCKGEVCAYLYDICPHVSMWQTGMKCQTFSRMKGD